MDKPCFYGNNSFTMPSYIVCFVFKQATLYTNEMCIYVKQFEQINIYEIFCHIWEKEVYERGWFKRILICRYISCSYIGQCVSGVYK